jgi:ATP-dependent RNA helicase DeaD
MCAPGGGLQALVLTASRDRAEDVALSVQRVLGPAGLRSSAAPVRPDGSLDPAGTPAECVVGRPSLLLPEVRLGRLGLGELKLLILDGVADLEDMDEWTSVEPILDTLSADAKRIAVTRRVDASFRELMKRQLPRGRRWPEAAFEEEPSAPDPAEEGYPARLEVALGVPPKESLAALVHAVEEDADVAVRCRMASDIPLAGAALESAGWVVQESPEGWDLAATRAPEEGRSGRVRAWYGCPWSLTSLGMADAESRAIAVVEPSHAAQVELLAGRAGCDLRFLPGPYPGAELSPLDRYRALLRARIEKGGMDAELLVIDPLVREFGTTRVAAALSDLYRRTSDGTSEPRPWADVEAASRRGEDRGGPRSRSAGRSGEGESDRAHRGARAAWSRIFIGAGNRDSVRAGDLVGAITGETGIAGAQIGKIDIKGNFSLVEIDSQVVDRVIEKLNGTAIRGREVVVKRDRER